MTLESEIPEKRVLFRETSSSPMREKWLGDLFNRMLGVEPPKPGLSLEERLALGVNLKPANQTAEPDSETGSDPNAESEPSSERDTYSFSGSSGGDNRDSSISQTQESESTSQQLGYDSPAITDQTTAETPDANDNDSGPHLTDVDHDAMLEVDGHENLAADPDEGLSDIVSFTTPTDYNLDGIDDNVQDIAADEAEDAAEIAAYGVNSDTDNDDGDDGDSDSDGDGDGDGD